MVARPTASSAPRSDDERSSEDTVRLNAFSSPLFRQDNTLTRMSRRNPHPMRRRYELSTCARVDVETGSIPIGRDRSLGHREMHCLGGREECGATGSRALVAHPGEGTRPVVCRRGATRSAVRRLPRRESNPLHHGVLWSSIDLSRASRLVHHSPSEKLAATFFAADRLVPQVLAARSNCVQWRHTGLPAGEAVAPRGPQSKPRGSDERVVGPTDIDKGRRRPEIWMSANALVFP